MTPVPPASLASVLFTELDPVLRERLYELVDVEVDGGAAGTVVRILLDRTDDHPLGRRIDLEGVAEATRVVDAHLESIDPIEQAFTLEVSSPGLERPLRTPAHFTRYVGAEISVKTIAGTPGDRRIQGILESADPDFGPDSGPDSGAPGITLDGRSIPYSAIERARTVFRWGEEERPTGPAGKASGKPGKQAPKKGTLPKGQRPVHPKVAAKLAEQQAAADASGTALASQAPVIHQLDPAPDAPPASPDASQADNTTQVDNTTHPRHGAGQTPEVAS
jgi:ribosome maturation factor RimP